MHQVRPSRETEMTITEEQGATLREAVSNALASGHFLHSAGSRRNYAPSAVTEQARAAISGRLWRTRLEQLTRAVNRTRSRPERPISSGPAERSEFKWPISCAPRLPTWFERPTSLVLSRSQISQVLATSATKTRKLRAPCGDSKHMREF